MPFLCVTGHSENEPEDSEKIIISKAYALSERNNPLSLGKFGNGDSEPKSRKLLLLLVVKQKRRKTKR